MKGYLRAKENWARSRRIHLTLGNVPLKFIPDAKEWKSSQNGWTSQELRFRVSRNQSRKMGMRTFSHFAIKIYIFFRWKHSKNASGELWWPCTSMTNHSTLNCRNVLIEIIQMDFQSFLSIPGRRSETRKPLYLSTKSTGESCNYTTILNDPHGFAPKM